MLADDRFSRHSKNRSRAYFIFRLVALVYVCINRACAFFFLGYTHNTRLHAMRRPCSSSLLLLLTRKRTSNWVSIRNIIKRQKAKFWSTKRNSDQTQNTMHRRSCGRKKKTLWLHCCSTAVALFFFSSNRTALVLFPPRPQWPSSVVAVSPSSVVAAWQGTYGVRPNTPGWLN